MKSTCEEGTWIAIPLAKGGFALGLLARVAKGGGLLCYLFRPRRLELPRLADAASLRSNEAFKIIRAGDLHLLEGKWKILGKLPHWNREDWPLPPYLRKSEITGKAWRVYYSEKDLLTVVREEPEPFDSLLEKNALYGAGAVEIMLDQVLE